MKGSNMKITHPKYTEISLTLVATIIFANININNSSWADNSDPLNRDDAEDAARALLFFSETKEYRGQFSGIKANGSWTWGSFTMSPDKKITELTIEDSNIPIPFANPLLGLPVGYDAPLQHYSVTLTAIDTKNRQKASGSFYIETLAADSVINITMIPGQIMTVIRYTPPAGVNTNVLQLQLTDGTVFTYDASDGGFDVWLDPFSADEEYEVIDGQTGQVLSVGMIGPTSAARSSQTKPVNMAYLDNVTEAYFAYDETTGLFGASCWLHNQTFDSTVMADGTTERAKVYITDLEHVTEKYGLMIWISDPDASITVKRWQETGDMPCVILTLMESTPGYQIQYVDDPTLEKLIITVKSPHFDDIFDVGIMAITE